MIGCADAPYRSALVLRNDAGELARMTAWILEVCNAAGLPPKTAFAVQLCLDEVVSNIIQHGKGEARASEIVASLTREPVGIVLAVEDDGAAFDPTGTPAPRRRESLDDFPIGGLGIHLIRQFANVVEYQREGGRNRLRLTFAAA
jgi:anti-sigma regulatory factor (Ser/Thr protein kinase)